MRSESVAAFRNLTSQAYFFSSSHTAVFLLIPDCMSATSKFKIMLGHFQIFVVCIHVCYKQQFVEYLWFCRVCLWSEILQLHSYYIEHGAMN